jgi:hypothetical protein
MLPLLTKLLLKLIFYRLLEFGFAEEDIWDALEENENDTIDALFQLLTGTSTSSVFFLLSISLRNIMARFEDLDENEDEEGEETDEIPENKALELKEQREFEVFLLL